MFSIIGKNYRLETEGKLQYIYKYKATVTLSFILDWVDGDGWHKTSAFLKKKSFLQFPAFFSESTRKYWESSIRWAEESPKKLCIKKLFLAKRSPKKSVLALNL